MALHLARHLALGGPQLANDICDGCIFATADAHVRLSAGGGCCGVHKDAVGLAATTGHAAHAPYLCFGVNVVQHFDRNFCRHFYRNFYRHFDRRAFTVVAQARTVRALEESAQNGANVRQRHSDDARPVRRPCGEQDAPVRRNHRAKRGPTLPRGPTLFRGPTLLRGPTRPTRPRPTGLRVVQQGAHAARKARLHLVRQSVRVHQAKHHVGTAVRARPDVTAQHQAKLFFSCVVAAEKHLPRLRQAAHVRKQRYNRGRAPRRAVHRRARRATAAAHRDDAEVNGTHPACVCATRTAPLYPHGRRLKHVEPPHHLRSRSRSRSSRLVFALDARSALDAFKLRRLGPAIKPPPVLANVVRSKKPRQKRSHKLQRTHARTLRSFATKRS